MRLTLQFLSLLFFDYQIGTSVADIDAPDWIELAYPRTKVYSRVHMDGKLTDMYSGLTDYFSFKLCDATRRPLGLFHVERGTRVSWGEKKEGRKKEKGFSSTPDQSSLMEKIRLEM